MVKSDVNYVRKVVENRPPNAQDTLEQDTIWTHTMKDELQVLYIQKSKNNNKPKWKVLGFEVTQFAEEFFRDENSFVEQATMLFDLNQEQVAHLKSILTQST